MKILLKRLQIFDEKLKSKKKVHNETDKII